MTSSSFALPHAAAATAKGTDAGVAASSPRRSSPFFSTPPLPSRTARRLYHEESDMSVTRPAGASQDALPAEPPAAGASSIEGASPTSASTRGATISIHDHAHSANISITTGLPLCPNRTPPKSPTKVTRAPQRARSTPDDAPANHFLREGDRYWTKREYDVFCSSLKRLGRDWTAIARDVEAFEGKARSADAMKSQYHRLRSKGLVEEVKEAAAGDTRPQGLDVGLAGPSSRTRPRLGTSSSSSSSSTRPSKAAAQPPKKRRPTQHRWTEEERQFLWRIGEKYHHSSSNIVVANKERAVYLDWKKRFPQSTLSSHVVTGYFYFMKKQRKEATMLLARGGGMAFSTSRAAGFAPRDLVATTTTTKRASSFTQRGRAQLGGGIEEQRVMGKGLTWTTAETKILEQIHDMGIVKSADWAATQTVFETFCRLLPGTLRTHNAVRNKWIKMFHSYDDAEDDDEEEGAWREGFEEEAAKQQVVDYRTLAGRPLSVAMPARQQQQQRSTSTSKISLLWPGNHHITSSPFSTTLQQQHQPSSTSFPKSSSTINKTLSGAPPLPLPRPPQLNLSTTLTSNGITFENLTPAVLGVAVYSPRAFQVLGLQQVDALTQGLERAALQLRLQPQPRAPAFLVQVVEQGAVKVLRAPEGSTTSLGVVRRERDTAARGGGEEGRTGIEYRIVGPDQFTLRLLT